METRLHFKDKDNTLRTISLGAKDLNLEAVKDQGKITNQIIEETGIIPVSPVLVLTY